MEQYCNMACPGIKLEQPITVKHQCTCPECQRTLVNLYPYAGEWICRRCVEKRMDAGPMYPQLHPGDPGYLSPNDGGCWFCCGEKGSMYFSDEWDSWFHEECCKEAAAKHNPEAEIIMREMRWT